MNDVARKARQEVTQLLERYNVAYRDAQRSGQRQSIEITLHEQTYTVPISGGDPRSWRNSLAMARNILKSAGIIEAQGNLPEDEPSEEPAAPSDPAQDEAMAKLLGDLQSQLETLRRREESLVAEREDLLTRNAHLTKVTADYEEQVISLKAEVAELDRKYPRRHTNEGYVIYHHEKYQIPGVEPAQFIALQLAKGILVPEGHVLVIPLHLRDTAWEMALAEFHGHFGPKKPEEVKAPESLKPEAKIEVTEEAETKTETETETDATAAAYTETKTETDVEANAEVLPPEEVELEKTIKRWEGPFSPWPNVGPQVGRALVTLLAMKERGQDTVVITDMRPWVNPGDAGQISAALNFAAKGGLVKRLGGQSLLRWRLTPTGVKAAKQMGPWPWDFRHLTRPEWMAEFLAEAEC